MRQLRIALATAACLVACNADKEGTASYHVRGVVQEVTGKGADARVVIHHEAIPDFKDRDGHATKMASMTMNFGFADSLPASSFVPKDKVEIDFDVRFSQTPPLLITRVQKLPADSQLVLSSE